MATNFPTSLQDLDATRGTSGQTLASPNHITHHALEDDTLEALQAKVGIDGSAVTSSLDYKVTNAASTDPGHKHTNSSITLAFNDLSDVSTAGATSGNFMAYNGTSWAPTTTSAPDASTTVKGVVKLDTAPASASNPIAVGDNSTRLPTQNENDALVGTSGTAVSSSNKLLDNADTTGTGLILRSSAGAFKQTIQVFTATGTYTKPSGAMSVDVYLSGAGGGGGSGYRDTGATSLSGGSGGGGGALSYKRFPASGLGSTETVTIGTGGAGGAGRSGTNGVGNNGNAGGASTFGTTVLLKAPGGSGGLAGASGSNPAGGAGGVIGNGDIQVVGGAGGTGRADDFPGDTGVDTASVISSRGGGAGGGINAASTKKLGGVGGAFITNYVKAGGAIGTIGNSSISLFYGGTGGGGSDAAVTSATGGAGINGSGGGGSGVGTTASGNGGAGGDGFCIVITNF